MVTRNSRYGWMTLGGLLCLLGLALACKARDGSRAQARAMPLVPVASETAEPPRAMPALGSALPDLPMPPKIDKGPSLPDVIQTGAVLPNTPTPPAPGVGTPASPILIPAVGTSPAPLPGVTTPVNAEQGKIIPCLGSDSPPLTKVDPPAPPPGIKPVPVELSTPQVSPTVPSFAPPPLPRTESVMPSIAPPMPPVTPYSGPATVPSPVTFKISRAGETFKTLARKTLGTAERWADIHKLNPTLGADATLVAGTTVRLPADATITEEGEDLRALPTLRPRTAAKTRAVLPLTGTFALTLDGAKGMTLPREIQHQFGGCDTVLVSPGSDRCLWITNQAHLDRLQAKLDKSPARESDVRGFKRLYYAQTVKCDVKAGRVQITEKLAQFADLGAEVVLVGIDDHFEVWDAARWKRYTQEKKAASSEE